MKNHIHNMMKFIKHYSLEIYTLISFSLITFSAIWIQPETAQKIILKLIANIEALAGHRRRKISVR